MLLDVCKHRKISCDLFWAELVNKTVKPEFRKEAVNKIREAENFFKHADRDPDHAYPFDPVSSEYMLFEATEAFIALTGERNAAILTYRAWWLSRNSNYVDAAFPEIKEALSANLYKENQKLQFYLDTLPMCQGSLG